MAYECFTDEVVDVFNVKNLITSNQSKDFNADTSAKLVSSILNLFRVADRVLISKMHLSLNIENTLYEEQCETVAKLIEEGIHIPKNGLILEFTIRSDERFIDIVVGFKDLKKKIIAYVVTRSSNEWSVLDGVYFTINRSDFVVNEHIHNDSMISNMAKSKGVLVEDLPLYGHIEALKKMLPIALLEYYVRLKVGLDKLGVVEHPGGCRVYRM